MPARSAQPSRSVRESEGNNVFDKEMVRGYTHATMRLRLPRLVFLSVASVIIVLGCATKVKQTPEPAPVTKVEPAVTEQPETVTQAPPVEETKPEVTTAVEQPKPEEPAPQPEKQPEKQPDATVAAEPAAPVKVSEEVYSRTFGELEALIRQWNAVIARKDYDTWFSTLSRAYIAERSSAAYLAELSRNQKLREKGAVLKTLRDYFLAVVVPARVDAGLDRIEFVSENKVKAYAIIGGDPAILFYVVREDGTWKVGTSAE